MMEFLRTTWLLFALHLWRIARSKRMLFCLFVALGPAALAFLVQRFPDAPPAVEIIIYPGWFLLLQVIVPILSVISGSAVFSEEVDDRTITYLFTRPLPRSALLIGRWLATALLLCSILGGSALLLAATARYGGGGGPGTFVPSGVVGPLVVAAVLGGAVYSAIFAGMGTFLKYPMIVGLAYTFAIEGFLANLPGKSQALTVQFYLRSYIVERGDALWLQIDGFDAQNMDTASGALITLGVVLIIALLLSSWTVSRRQYLLTS